MINYWIFRVYLFIRQSKFTILKLIPSFFHISWLSSRWHITTQTEYAINLWLNMRKLDKSILLCLKTNRHSVRSEKKKKLKWSTMNRKYLAPTWPKIFWIALGLNHTPLEEAFKLFTSNSHAKEAVFPSLPTRHPSHHVQNTVLLELYGRTLPKCHPHLAHLEGLTRLSKITKTIF